MLSRKKEPPRFVGVSGILARLWFEILKDLNIAPEFLRSRIMDYVQRSNKTGDTTSSRREYASNIAGQLASVKMTFRNLYRGLSIIGVVKVELSAKLYYKRANPTIHSVEFSVSKDTDDDGEIQGENGGQSNPD